MAEENEDERQFFKDLGATAEQTVEEVRGIEYCFNVIGRMVAALPWLEDFNKKMQSYFEQDFTSALEFAHELRQAKDMQDFVRIQSAYFLKCLHSFAAQGKDFSDTCTKMATGRLRRLRCNHFNRQVYTRNDAVIAAMHVAFFVRATSKVSGKSPYRLFRRLKM